MRQRTFASQARYQKYGRKSRRELFLDAMDFLLPWSAMCLLVEPHYPKADNGRRPVGLEIMLRTYFVQQWFNLSGPGVEEALYESPVLQRFTGVDLGAAPAPDETTICRFRHLLEKHDLCGLMLENGEPPSGGEEDQDRDRHDPGRRLGCDHYSRAFFDQERKRRTRSGDAPDQKG
jgi:IS5 family transposase